LRIGSVSKFIFAVCLAAGAVQTSSAMFVIIAIPAAGGALFLWTGKFSAVGQTARAAIWFFVFIFVLHLFFHKGERIFSILFLSATAEGARTGLFYGAKFIVFAFCAHIILRTVDPFELVRPIERLARLLGHSGRSISYLATSFSLALRFLPDLVRQANIAALALKTRGAAFDRGFYGRLRSAVQLLPAVFVNAFKSSESAALALVVKGYSTRHLKAVFPPIRISPAGITAAIISGAIMILGWRS